MKKVLLQFEDILDLVDFITLTNNLRCEINKSTLTLHCVLSEIEVELATNGYNAIILLE